MPQPHTALLETLEQAQPFLSEISNEAAARKPAPGKWSKKEIVGHLIDSAGNNQQKFVRTMLAPGGHLDFVGYAQDEWVEVQNYQASDWPTLLAHWRSVNLHLAHLMKNCPPEKFGNTISIADNGPFRLDFIMADYVEHLKHHLKAVVPEADLVSAFFNAHDA